MSPHPDVVFTEADPRSDEARRALDAYAAELDRRFPDGFASGDGSVDDAPQLVAPEGTFVVVRTVDGAVVGCGGVQSLAPGVGEVKRMWVAPSRRGFGVGAALLDELEHRALALGHHLLRLDTRAVLTEAVALYRRAGYVEIEAYNDNPRRPDLFFEKRIGPDRDPGRS